MRRSPWPGTYFETVNYHGKDIILKSEMGPAVTTIDASGGNVPVVTFESGETAAVVLDGFTITGGSLAGVECNASGATIRNNRMTQNMGPGVFGICDNPAACRPVVEDNRIYDNASPTLGGGILMWGSVAPRITGNCIQGNEAVSGDGGGIALLILGDGIIRDNTVVDNTAGDHGGGIYAGRMGTTVITPEISWNVVAGNRALAGEHTGDSGGGIWIGGTSAWVHHNTIVGNSGGMGSDPGGGISVFSSGSPVVEKNIIALTARGGALFCSGGTTPTIQNNLVWQNGSDLGSGDCVGWQGTAGCERIRTPGGYFGAGLFGGYSRTKHDVGSARVDVQSGHRAGGHTGREVRSGRDSGRLALGGRDAYPVRRAVMEGMRRSRRARRWEPAIFMGGGLGKRMLSVLKLKAPERPLPSRL